VVRAIVFDVPGAPTALATVLGFAIATAFFFMSV
jgi:hypothetical protein